MSVCQNQIPNFEFSEHDIVQTVQRNGLLSMEIEFSLRCNFQCKYCYIPHASYFKDELSQDEIRDVILQARDLGARKIIILGGEPSIYPAILDMICFIRELELEIEMFTNGSGITEHFAQQLFAHRVRVVLKMNSFDEQVQDQLAGKKGAFQIIHSALDHLKHAGYPSHEAFLAASTVMCRPNQHELVALWTWLRDRQIVPYFEIITPQGHARENTGLDLTPLELKTLFTQIAEIDRERYGQVWAPQPPLVGNRCMRHQFSCTVTSLGSVLPCVGITHPIGNIRQQKLATILKESQELQLLKDYKNTIKGPCGICDQRDHCYGCRGAAYQVTGDFLASDPLCWRNHSG